jgi:hypothetical protein
MSRRDPTAWVNGRPGWTRHERNHTLHDAILYGLITALTLHAIFTVAFSPSRRKP